MDKILHLNLLYDFYGNLLTDKQKNFFEMYYQNDFSLNEIAEKFSISPQGVRDLLKRTEKILLNYEKNLFLLKMYVIQKYKIDKLTSFIDDIISENECNSCIKKKITFY